MQQAAAAVASSGAGATDTNPPAAKQQPWVHMQFPHMVMPHQMVAAAAAPPPPPPPPQFPQHFMPFHPARAAAAAAQFQAAGNGGGGGGGGGGEDNKTIWVGDLHYWMDENYLANCFVYTGEVHNIKVIRNKLTGHSEGYGFVEFKSRGAAEKVLQTFSGHIMPNTDQPFRLNWASFSMGERRGGADVASDHSIFVGDLAADVTDAVLLETFASRYPSVKGAKVVIDANTGRSKGYGFVRFGNDDEKAQAMTEMNGKYCSTRAMRIGPATPRKSSGPGSNGNTTPSDGGDVTNTTVFVGGLDPDVSEDDLRQAFLKYGEISSVKVPAGKQCGFVQFAQRKSAEEALQGLNGTAIGKQTVRLSWGRNPANKQVRGGDMGGGGNQWNGMYYTGQFYNGYGYGAPFPDPSMYAAAYGSYPFYGNQQQVN